MKQENTIMENRSFRPLDLKKKMRPAESVIQSLLFLAGFLSIFITLAIVYELGKEAWLFFGDPDVTFAKFFGTTEWSPGIGKYGIWPLVTSTLITSLIAILVSLPLGLAAALFLSEYAPPESACNIKTHPRNPGRHPNRCLRIFCLALHDSPLAKDPRRWRGSVQHALGWHRDGSHDPAVDLIHERRRLERSASRSA